MYREEMRRRKNIFYYESIKRELNKRLILGCRCDARIKAKAEGSARLAFVLVAGEHFLFLKGLLQEMDIKILQGVLKDAFVLEDTYDAQAKNNDFLAKIPRGSEAQYVLTERRCKTPPFYPSILSLFLYFARSLARSCV